MKIKKAESKLYNLTQYIGSQHIATLYWNLPYVLIKFKKRVEETNKNHLPKTYFKIELNEKSNSSATTYNSNIVR